MPTARPMMLASASGELKTRSLPNCRCRPCVTLNTPPLPCTSSRLASRLQSATSSPKTTMRGLRAISSLSVRLMAATIVSGLPSGSGVGGERRRGRVDVRREHPQRGRVARRLRRRERPLGGLVDLALDLGVHRVEVLRRWRCPAPSANCASLRDRVAPRLPPRAPPASCRAARRPTASASTAGRPSRAPAPGPRRARA